MPREFPRARRIEEQLKRLLSELVRREVKDPRVGLITITTVEVSRDLTHARVYFTPFAGIGDSEGSESEAPFTGNGYRGKWRVNSIPDCAAVRLTLVLIEQA